MFETFDWLTILTTLLTSVRLAQAGRDLSRREGINKLPSRQAGTCLIRIHLSNGSSEDVYGCCFMLSDGRLEVHSTDASTITIFARGMWTRIEEVAPTD